MYRIIAFFGDLLIPMMFSGFALLISAGLFMALYVLQSIGLYRIAQRRGIPNSWLAWVPVGNSFVAGAIADGYRNHIAQKDLRLRLLTPVASAVVLVLSGVRTVLLWALFFITVILAEAREDEIAAFIIFLVLFLLVGLSLVIRLFSIAHSALVIYDSYNLFASCEPKRKLIYLLITLGVGILALRIPTLGGSVPVFLCRDKDLGMTAPAAPEE